MKRKNAICIRTTSFMNYQKPHYLLIIFSKSFCKPIIIKKRRERIAANTSLNRISRIWIMVIGKPDRLSHRLSRACNLWIALSKPRGLDEARTKRLNQMNRTKCLMSMIRLRRVSQTVVLKKNRTKATPGKVWWSTISAPKASTQSYFLKSKTSIWVQTNDSVTC